MRSSHLTCSHSTVTVLHHNVLLSTRRNRFIDSSADEACYYTDLLKEYFEGKWATREKPFIYNERQMKKLSVPDPNSTALRFIHYDNYANHTSTYI